MTRISVSLDNVLCLAREDSGHDEFYLDGVIVERGPSTQDPKRDSATVLTRPLQIGADEELRFGIGGGSVFEKDVEPDSVLTIALTGWEEDVGKDWNDYKGLFDAANTTIGSGIAIWKGPAAGELAKQAGNLIAEAIKADTDDRLGYIAEDIPVSALRPGVTRKVAVLEGEHLESHFRYVVKYSVKVGDGEAASLDGPYLIYSLDSGKVLDVARAEHREGAQLIQYGRHGRSNQQFAIELVHDDWYRIVAQHSGMVLSTKDAARSSGTPVMLWTCHDEDHQVWQPRTRPVFEDPGQHTTELAQPAGNLECKFLNKASGLFMTVKGDSKSDKAPVEINVSGPGQYFRLLSL